MRAQSEAPHGLTATLNVASRIVGSRWPATAVAALEDQELGDQDELHDQLHHHRGGSGDATDN